MIHAAQLYVTITSGKTNIYIQSCVAHSCTRFACYLGNQCKDPMDNNKDCRVGQLTTEYPKAEDFIFDIKDSGFTSFLLEKTDQMPD